MRWRAPYRDFRSDFCFWENLLLPSGEKLDTVPIWKIYRGVRNWTQRTVSEPSVYFISDTVSSFWPLGYGKNWPLTEGPSELSMLGVRPSVMGHHPLWILLLWIFFHFSVFLVDLRAVSKLRRGGMCLIWCISVFLANISWNVENSEAIDKQKYIFINPHYSAWSK